MPHDPALAHALLLARESRAGVARLPAAEHVALQESTLAAVLDGRYDGALTVGELLAHGDHGIGTLNGLDGEMIILDGEAWRAGADGAVGRVAATACTPFAVVTRLGDAETVDIAAPVDDAALHALLDARMPPGAHGAVVRIDGRFTRIHARSVARQHPPYRPLAQVAQEQVQWTWHDLEATVVGFRFDRSAAGLDVVGHHLHVLSADRTRGGHVLGCDLRAGSARIEALAELHLELPDGVGLPDAGAVDEDVVARLERERR